MSLCHTYATVRIQDYSSGHYRSRGSWCWVSCRSGLSTAAALMLCLEDSWLYLAPLLPCWEEGAEHGFPLQNTCRSRWRMLSVALDSSCLAVRVKIRYFPDSSKSRFVTCSGRRNDINCVTCCLSQQIKPTDQMNIHIIQCSYSPTTPDEEIN